MAPWFCSNLHSLNSRFLQKFHHAILAFVDPEILVVFVLVFSKTFYAPYASLLLTLASRLKIPPLRKINLNNQTFDLHTDVFGLSVEAFYKNQDTSPIQVHAKDFDTDLIPVDYLFRNYDEMPMIEKTAIDLSDKKVLDIGCCTGSHLLDLNKKNHDVYGIDISEKSVQVCQQRGLKNVIKEDFFTLDNSSYKEFDTVLLLMNGIGIVGKVDRLDKFFNKLKEIIKPEARIYLDSTNLKYLFDEDEFDHYYGEMSYQISYKNYCSEKFDWLYLDFEKLKISAEKNGFNCRFLIQEHESYLAELKLF